MCEYEFQGHKFNSEEEYKEFILRGGDKLYNKYGDLVFSALDNVVTQEQLSKISEEAKKYTKAYEEAKRNYIDGEDDLEFKPPYIGVTKFLSGLTNEKNKLLTPEFIEFEYWTRRIKDWKDPEKGFNSDEIEVFGKSITITDSVTDKELKNYLDNFDKNQETSNQILQLIRQIKNKWIQQGQLGTEIHQILALVFNTIKSDKRKGQLVIDQNESYIRSYINLQYKDKKLDQNTINSIIKYAKQLRSNITKLFGDNLSFFPEFKVVSKLSHEVPGKGDTILGIIDLLVVDQEGNAHVIDYKTSPKDSFSSAKTRSFWYQLGIYDRMLTNLGIRTNSKTPKVLVAPIKMDNFRQNEQGLWTFDTISKRLGEDPLEDITVYSTLNEVSQNIDEFLPPKPVIDLTPKEIISSVQKIMSTSFPKINTSKVWQDEDIKKLMKDFAKFDKKLNKWVFQNENSKQSFTADNEGELFEKVKKYYTETLPRKRKDIVESVIISLKKGIKENTSLVPLPRVVGINIDEGASAEWFKNIMGKYCRNNYELIENEVTKSYGIILLKNKSNNQIDILKVTTDDLDHQHKFNNSDNRKLLTGANELDSVQAKKSGSLALTAINGNIHLMETMSVLNCLPEITSGGSIIGDIQVVNPSYLQGTYASNEELIYNFNELITHVEGVQNNIKNIKFATKVDLAKNKFKEIMDLGDKSNWQEGKYKFASKFQTLYTQLERAMSESDRRDIIRKLEDLRKQLEEMVPTSTSISLDTYNESEQEARSLLNKVIIAIAEMRGISFRQQTKDNQKWIESMKIHENGVQSLMLDNPGNLNNETLNQLTKLISEAYQNVREDMANEVAIIRNLVNNLKKSKNFNKLKEMTFGNQSSLFSNMIKYENGDMLFKNPWDMTIQMSKEERDFLKYALEKINENRFPNKDLIEMRLSNDIEYFRVPLAVGNFASQSEQLGSLRKAFLKKLSRLNPKVWWEETQKQLLGVFSDDTQKQKKDDLFSMNNMFDQGQTTDQRLQILSDKGFDYFETNLETLLLKHIFAYSTKKNVDLIMPMAKASMIHLVVQGQYSNKKFINATNYVTEYIKSHIKNESLIPENQKKFAAYLGQAKQAASFLSLAFSPVQYGYQLIQQLWNDIRLVIQAKGQENSPFTLENFTFAFKQVYKDMFKLGNSPTKCSLLNEFFGINDMDANTLADKLKSDQYGIYNWTNLAYHCSSRPDFFNRMAIIVSIMKKDGTWDAYSIKNGKLKYDWKKDSRFSLLAQYGLNSNNTDPKYLQQKGLYYAMAEQLEREHAKNEDGTLFTIGQPLPKAYTSQQMEGYKSITDEIYGYYSHEKKAMIHSYTIGALWMQMKTYWSSKKNQYLGAPGIKLQGKYIHQKDQDGNLLYLKEENGKLIPTTENTGLPLYKWEGQWQEGILLTLSRFITNGIHNGISQTYHDMWYNEDENLRNLYRVNLRQLLYDLFMFLIFGSIITGVLKGWDDELAKEAKESGSIDQAVVASGAHMAIKMVTSSFLDLNFVESIGSPIVSWQPMAFSFWGRRLSDICDVFSGDKSLTDALIRMSNVTGNTKTFWDAVLK